jgi:hypothetical protein
MSSKKINNILSILEIAENNLKTAKNLLQQINDEKGLKTNGQTVAQPQVKTPVNPEEDRAMEVVEGYFDGENMVGDNGQIYSVPQNYASKTQLVIGDRMKWILTNEREIYKLIQPAPRERVVGTFSIEGDNYVCLVDEFSQPVKILKASATFAMKNFNLQVGDEIAIIIPKNSTPLWGAFSSVVKQTVNENGSENHGVADNLDDLSEFKDAAKTEDNGYF